MLSDVLREKTDKWIAKKRKEKLEKAYAEGHAEMQKLCEDWYERLLESKAKGEPFDEPLPSLDRLKSRP